MNESKLRSGLIEVLGSDVVPWSEVGRRLASAGSRVSESAVHHHIQRDTSFIELAGGIAYLPAIVDGVAFASPVTQADADAGYMAIDPWFEVISWWLIGGEDVGGVELLDARGESLGWIDTDGLMVDGVDTDVLVGPDGWLDPFVGRWMALRVDTGSLVIEPLDGRPTVASTSTVDDVSDGIQTALRAVFDRIAERQQFRSADGEDWSIARAPIDDVFTEAIAADRPTFAGATLVVDDEFLEDAGLRIDRGQLVATTAEAEVLEAATRERTMTIRFGVTASEAADVSMLLDAMERFTVDDPAALDVDAEQRHAAPALFAAQLEKPAIALAVATETGVRGTHEFALGFASALIEANGDGTDPMGVPWSLRWLRAHCLLALGEVDTAAEVLRHLPMVDRHVPLLVDRARIEIIASRFGDARRLLLKAERLIDPERLDTAAVYHRYPIEDRLDEIGPWADTPPKATARRNDPCPCGSGRKYKVCHQGRELHPIEERSAWLWHKMTEYAGELDPFTLEHLHDLFDEAMGGDGSGNLSVSPFIPDLLLHEMEVDGVFIAEAQKTLPDDEVLLAQQWQLVDRSVFEVEAGREGTLELKDLATGDRLTVVNVDGLSSGAGTLLVGRPLPVGDVYRAFAGFVSLPPRLVDDALRLIEHGSAVELVEFLGAVHAPPRLANTDGESLEFVELTWLIPERGAPTDAEIDAGLVAEGFRSDDDAWVLVRDTSNQKDAVIATVRREGALLLGSVNSRQRADELIELVESALPALDLVDRVASAVSDIDLTDDDGSRLERLEAEQAALMANPEIRQLLEARIAEYEAEWLDTEIPALDGWTPRDAAADPIKREALTRLLATFPDPPADQPGMSGSRLRAELGL